MAEKVTLEGEEFIINWLIILYFKNIIIKEFIYSTHFEKKFCNVVLEEIRTSEQCSICLWFFSDVDNATDCVDINVKNEKYYISE